MISVIVPALNEEKDLGACLERLYLSCQRVREGCEIIVVDGGSGDGTVDVAKDAADLVISQTSRGIGGARRDGAAVACGEKLAFTDADTIVSPDWLQSISSNLDDWGASTGPVVYMQPGIRSEIIENWRSLYRLLSVSNFHYIIGSNMAVSADAYWQAGGHSEISLLDDYDLSLRLFRKGASVRYDPDQAVYTSSRRVERLFTYALTVAFGHYHYVTGNREKLLYYPKPEAMNIGALQLGLRSTLGAAQSSLQDRIKRII
jgi:glycosyltransferase involved in cell wall biosynthesis